MKILLDIPLEDYNDFLEKCESTRPEYEMLRNGIITQDRRQRPAVEILCDVTDAEMILQLALEICPYLAPHVQERIAFSRRL